MGSDRLLISIVTGCFNEEANLPVLYEEIKRSLSALPGYDYEIIVADNCSSDRSRVVLRSIAAKDPNFRVILNSNNFGPFRSGYHAFMQASGDAVILMSSDLQDPPALIEQMVKVWERGCPVVIAARTGSSERRLISWLRNIYYRVLRSISDRNAVIPGFTGFGLYDRKVMDALRLYQDPCPYLRGYITEIGFPRRIIYFTQPARLFGRSKHTLRLLAEIAISGIMTHSRLPLRISTVTGFAVASASLLIAVGYLVYKLVYWQTFALGIAPVVIGLFFLGAVQLIFLGILGEYIGAILAHIKNRPLVIEEERINFT